MQSFPSASLGVIHENRRMGSDGESEEISGTSDEKDDVISPVKLRAKHPRFSAVSRRFNFPLSLDNYRP